MWELAAPVAPREPCSISCSTCCGAPCLHVAGLIGCTRHRAPRDLCGLRVRLRGALCTPRRRQAAGCVSPVVTLR